MGYLVRERAAPAPVPAVEWEEVHCPLCAGRRWSHLVEAPDTMTGGRGLWFAVVQCQECGLCYTNPRPAPASIDQFYPPAYWPQRAPNPRERKGAATGIGRRWLRLRGERRLLRWQGMGRLLDFGCGGGAFLERMHRCGWQVTGLDPSDAAVRRIRTDLRLRALVGTLPHPDLRPGTFDVVTMWHSLEHVHQPRHVLQQAYDLLVPGGRVLIAVPNIDSLSFRCFGPSWFGLDLPRHLTHFAPATLQAMLERTGFRVRRLRMAGRSGWLRSSARLARQRSTARAWRHWLVGKATSRLVCGYSNLTAQADSIVVDAERVG